MHACLDYGLDVNEFASNNWEYIEEDDQVFEDLQIVKTAADEEENEV